MIVSFSCKQTEKIWQGIRSRKLPANIQSVARRKLRMLHNAHAVEDLREPPGNRLEKLSGDRSHMHSIRINNQWRLCFVWQDDAAHDVEIVDYH